MVWLTLSTPTSILSRNLQLNKLTALPRLVYAVWFQGVDASAPTMTVNWNIFQLTRRGDQSSSLRRSHSLTATAYFDSCCCCWNSESVSVVRARSPTLEVSENVILDRRGSQKHARRVGLGTEPETVASALLPGYGFAVTPPEGNSSGILPPEAKKCWTVFAKKKNLWRIIFKRNGRTQKRKLIKEVYLRWVCLCGTSSRILLSESLELG